MNTYALLRSGGKPTAEESMKNYDGNICRCTGYRNLVQASPRQLSPIGLKPEVAPCLVVLSFGSVNMCIYIYVTCA